MKIAIKIILITLMIIPAGCATFKTPLNGKFESELIKNTDAEDVRLVFIFNHYKQTKGIDAIPKLMRAPGSFDDIFRDALKEISNIEKYNSYTMEARDINNKQKRENIIREKKGSDYIIEFDLMKEKSFVKFFFGTIVSSVTATIVPIRYKYKYTVKASVYDHNQQAVKTYERDAELNKWFQCFMVFVYPFHHEKRETEEFYSECMHDIFKQIETEKILDYKKLKNVSRTIYSSKEICDIIESYVPADVLSWKKDNLNNWVEYKDIGIIVHFPDDGLKEKMVKEAFKTDIETLDKKTEEKGIIYWVDKEEKYPVLLISARNETVLKSQLENNNHLKVMLNGMFYLSR